MQTKAPQVGKTYVSSTTPSFEIYVEDCQLIDADDDGSAGFYVEGCEPRDKDDMDSMAYSFIDEEWIEHGFTPVSA